MSEEQTPERTSAPSIETEGAGSGTQRQLQDEVSLRGAAGAINFLRKLYPAGPWVITAIAPDRKGIETLGFAPGAPKGRDVPDCARFIAKHEGRWNLYFSINEPLDPFKTKKAAKDKIRVIHFAHVDIDYRAGEDPAAEKARILGLLTERLPAGVAAPTAVWLSGGGAWAIWRLAEPATIDGDIAKAEEFEQTNRWLEYELTGDNCFDVSRIARLPGTTNIPDQKKIAKGRVPAVAELVFFDDTRLYAREVFGRVGAPGTDQQGERGSANPKKRGGRGKAKSTPELDSEERDVAEIPADRDVPRIASVDELMEQYALPERIKVAIEQGRDAENPKEGDDSRSAWLFDVVCTLMRAKVPDPVVYGVITDERFGISESVLALGRNARKYALKQLRSAREAVISPRLREMNERYFVTAIGGKARVVEWQLGDMEHGIPRMVLLSFGDFANLWRNQLVEVGKDKDQKPKREQLGKWWLDHPLRRQYDQMLFQPGLGNPEALVPEGIYNVWRGFAVEPQPGTCDLFLAHVCENICSKNVEHYEYLLNWMAYCVQHPERQGLIAVVLRGARGTGKTSFGDHFGSLFGPHYLLVSDDQAITGNFNAHLWDKVVVVADEAFFAANRAHEGRLKSMITGRTMLVEPKGVDKFSAQNRLHLIMATNHDWAVPAGMDERRFFVLDVSGAKAQNTAYFRAIDHEMRSGGREALLHMLLTRDLSQHDPHQCPTTEALHDQKMHSLSSEEAWWYEKLEGGHVLGKEWPDKIETADLYADYIGHCDRMRATRRTTSARLGEMLKKWCPGIRRLDRKVGGMRKYYFELPTLEAARAAWESRFPQRVWSWPVAEPPREDDPTPF